MAIPIAATVGAGPVPGAPVSAAAPDRTAKQTTMITTKGPRWSVAADLRSGLRRGRREAVLVERPYVGERPTLPMIDLALSKENAARAHLFGMFYDGWAPNPEEDGLTVFIQGYEKRGPDNERKKIYMSATTPDLYAAQYAPKVTPLLRPTPRRRQRRQAADARVLRALLRPLLGPPPRGQPATPSRPRCGRSAPASPPSSPTRSRRWTSCARTTCACASCATRSRPGSTAACRPSSTVRFPIRSQTFVYYWLKNAGDGENFRRKDIVFECFHNFVAFSQWGNTHLQDHGAAGRGPRRPESSGRGTSGRWRTIRTRRTAARSPRSIGS